MAEINLKNAKRGHFVKTNFSKIYREIYEVWEDKGLILCAAIKFDNVFDFVLFEDVSKIVDQPIGENWIRVDRVKGFRKKRSDNFNISNEEYHKIKADKVKWEDLKENDYILNNFEILRLTKKINEKTWETIGCEKKVSVRNTETVCKKLHVEDKIKDLIETIFSK